ncbi:hypothetical protein D3C81_1010520 [compost metagenome]
MHHVGMDDLRLPLPDEPVQLPQCAHHRCDGLAHVEVHDRGARRQRYFAAGGEAHDCHVMPIPHERLCQPGHLLFGAASFQSGAEKENAHSRDGWTRHLAPYPVTNVRNVFTPISKSSASEQCLT